MNIVKIDEVERMYAKNDFFTGPDASLQLAVPQDSQFKAGLVRFGKGVRNKFHTHSSDQILIVTEGKGIVATDQGQQEVVPGDVVFFPAGEKHWHGATEDSAFAHWAIAIGGSDTTQVED